MTPGISVERVCKYNQDDVLQSFQGITYKARILETSKSDILNLYVLVSVYEVGLMASVSQNQLKRITRQASLATESNLQTRRSSAATWPNLRTGRLPMIV